MIAYDFVSRGLPAHQDSGAFANNSLFFNIYSMTVIQILIKFVLRHTIRILHPNCDLF